MTLTAKSELYAAITEDGSISLVSGEHGELFHDLSGAYTEALLSYSQIAFCVWRILYGPQLPPVLNVLDCCFGLGYNSFVLAQETPPGLNLNITGIEIDPCVLAYVPQVLAQACFRSLAQSGVGPAQASAISQFKTTRIESPSKNSTLTFSLIQSCLREYLFTTKQDSEQHFDLVVHGPFSPKRMPELWTIDLFSAYKQKLKDGGMILTYSSAPAVRGALIDLGFSVYRTAAPGGKWGGTLAVKGAHLEKQVLQNELVDKIMSLGDEAVARLAKSSRVPYRDPNLDGQRDLIVSAREAEQKAFAPIVAAKS